MFGLDEWMAGMSGGGSIASSCSRPRCSASVTQRIRPHRGCPTPGRLGTRPLGRRAAHLGAWRGRSRRDAGGLWRSDPRRGALSPGGRPTWSRDRGRGVIALLSPFGFSSGGVMAHSPRSEIGDHNHPVRSRRVRHRARPRHGGARGSAAPRGDSFAGGGGRRLARACAVHRGLDDDRDDGVRRGAGTRGSQDVVSAAPALGVASLSFGARGRGVEPCAVSVLSRTRDCQARAWHSDLQSAPREHPRSRAHHRRRRPSRGLLEEKLRRGPLRVKLGIDPTPLDIHLGFALRARGGGVPGRGTRRGAHRRRLHRPHRRSVWQVDERNARSSPTTSSTPTRRRSQRRHSGSSTAIERRSGTTASGWRLCQDAGRRAAHADVDRRAAPRA